MRRELVQKFAAPVPRYTSYPTALKFDGSVTAEHYASWLGELDPDEPVSVYVHIPFCRSICWYCGCHAKAVRREGPVARYLESLEQEISLVGDRLPARMAVSHLHCGGGSPNSLSRAHIRRLGAVLNTCFDLQSVDEFAVEIDPRFVTREQAEAFFDIGVNRVSFGVQDFDADVQAAIGRLQSFETTRAAVALFRECGIDTLNIDLVYGLPGQTRASAARTIDGVLELEPSRIALFGYAHLPEKFARQRLIDDDALPKTEQRFALSNRMASLFVAAGFKRVGLDHFARFDDALATGPIRRNFQGYTSDPSPTLIGLGATSISKLPQGFAQNAVSVGQYQRDIDSGAFATNRGYVLSPDDRVRAHAIERLMCDLAFCAEGLRDRFGQEADVVISVAEDVVASDQDGLVERAPSGFYVTEKGRVFLRALGARFDAHFATAGQAFSRGV